MSNIMEDYFRRLTCAGISLDFVSVHCMYGKFTIYCLIGPEENIIHVSFASKGHEQVKKQLATLNNRVSFRNIRQENFRYNKVFKNYFTGNLARLPFKNDSPFIDAGSPFQQRVWMQISAIPYGSTITYQELAEQAGSPKGARAAGMACGANPLPIIIPCHRVVAQNGIGGFGGGVALKKSLLNLEHADRIF